MFKKGVSGNPGGRPKGSVNKFAGELRMILEKVVTDNKDNIISDFRKLSPRDKWRVLLDINQYFNAKLQSTQMEVDVNSEIDNLSEKQVNEIYDIIISSNGNDHD